MIMTSNKLELMNLVENIINQELNETEQQNYKLEGEEFIDKILKTERTSVVNYNENGTTGFDFGLSPDTLELIKQGATFSSIIISIFNIYLEFKKVKKSKDESQLTSFELKDKVYKTLMEQNLPDDLKVAIKEKYATQLLTILDKLD